MQSEVVAHTALGALRGELVDSVPTFRGVPYARFTGRFRAAAAPDPWEAVRWATTPSARCPQGEGSLFSSGLGEYFAGGRVGVLGLDRERDAEDCLQLSIVTPALDSEPRPVIVYLHGGGFMLGSGIVVTAAQRFAAESDVVLVGVNHRLGVFGFLAPEGSGGVNDRPVENVGMLDLLEALRWVRAHIAAFGGDPGRVTVLGDSGGGAKVATLLAMPDARGLFHGAVLQSAPGLAMRTPEQAHADAQAVAALAGGDPTGMPAAELFALGLRMPPWAFIPVVDGTTVVADPFSAAAAEVMPEVPVLVGHDADEFTMFVPGGRIDAARADEVVRLLAGDAGGAGAAGEIAAEYGAGPGWIDPVVALRAASDAVHGPAVEGFVRHRVAAGGTAFAYRFEHVPPHDGGSLGAFHNAELPLALRLVRHPQSEPVSRPISAAWAAFARTGSPSSPGFVWPAATPLAAAIPPAPTPHAAATPTAVPQPWAVFDDDGAHLAAGPVLADLGHLPFWVGRQVPPYAEVLALLQSP